jgi:hypothetical protein
MLDSVPDETTELLIDLCTTTGPLTVEQPPEPTSPTKQGTAASYLSFMALNRGSTTEAAAPPSPTTTVATAKPESRRQGTVADDAKTLNGADTAAPSQLPSTKPSPPNPVKRPSPRVYFAHFVNHLDRFVLFLETVAARRWGQTLSGMVPVGFSLQPVEDEELDKADQVAVWNTLRELYLSLPSGSNPDAKLEEAFRSKALKVLQSDALPHDATHALMLCSTAHFTPGLVLLWERLGMHEDVLRFWMDRDKTGESGASGEVVRYLRLYGAARPQLYPLVLRFLTGEHSLLARHATDVAEVLEHIEAEKIMSPVAVVQVLSRNGVASVGLVKQWLMTRIKEAREDIRTVRSNDV